MPCLERGKDSSKARAQDADCQFVGGRVAAAGKESLQCILLPSHECPPVDGQELQVYLHMSIQRRSHVNHDDFHSQPALSRSLLQEIETMRDLENQLNTVL